MAALSRALVGRHEARAVTRLLEGVGPALVLLACLVSQARGVIYPPGPAGSCPDTLVIRNVQDSTVACHPAVDDTVQGVRGVITAFDNKPTGFAFYLQNTFAAAPHPWTGIFVNTVAVNYRSAPYNLALGDSVAVYGKVTEFQQETEFIAPNQSFGQPNLVVRKISSGSALPPPAIGTTSAFNWDPSVSAVTAEPWEGCLVRLYGPLRVARTQTGAGLVLNTFLIVNPSAASDSVMIDGTSLTTFTPPSVGTDITFVQGIVNQRTIGGLHYRIQLRDSSDISIEPPTPHNVTATAQCGSIVVNWDLAPGATGYKVKRDGVVISGASQLAGPPFVDASPGIVQHCYTVCAVLSDVIDGDCSSASCALAPDVAPTVTNPSNRTYAVGASGGFGVSATGVGLTYVWRKNGVPISGAPNTRTLTLSNIQVGDAGSYDVQVCNACGCDTSAVATLTVCPTLTIASLPSLIRAVEGAASAQISTSVSNAVSMKWYRSGVPLSDGAKFSGTTTSTLTISNVAAGDAGFYELRAISLCGAVKRSNSSELQVSPCTTSLTIATQPTSQSVPIGAPATFSIFVPSCTTPVYQWQKYSASPPKWNVITGATGTSYTIPSVAAADAGGYRCVVGATGTKSVISNAVSLNVVVPKFLTVTPKPVSCTSASVFWTASLPMTVVANYGTVCTALNNATVASPLATSGTAILTLANQSSVLFNLVGQTAQSQSAASICKPAYFTNTPASLRVQVSGLPSYGDLYGTDDGIPVRIRLDNTGCTPILGPIALATLTMANKPPRRPDHSIDVPQDLTVTGLGAGQSLVIDDIMFSRTEIGALPGASVAVSGTIQYGTPSRTVRVSARIRLP